MSRRCLFGFAFLAAAFRRVFFAFSILYAAIANRTAREARVLAHWAMDPPLVCISSFALSLGCHPERGIFADEARLPAGRDLLFPGCLLALIEKS